MVSIFLDLSEAFDTVNHSIWLSKLDLYGKRGNENQWFRSYLSNRKQKVFVNGVESNCMSFSKLRGTIRANLRSFSLSYLHE